MAKVVIFGVQDFAELAHYYLSTDSEHEVVAFCVNAQYLPEARVFKGLPVVAFEEVENLYSPNDHSFFAPMAPKGMNMVRKNVYESIKQKGYSLISYISSRATVLNEGKIGDNCFILEDNTIQPFTTIGNNVVLWSGNHIGHHGKIEDHVQITSHVVMSGHVVIGECSFLGVNASLRDGINLAPGTLVGMGAVVSRSTEEWSVYVGNPAKRLEGKNSREAL
jgi:sugar O-acyltransferase (sialic acid O-acetyltransferase NeuD family)